MRVFEIKGARHNGKQITVSRYRNAAKGVEIEVKHNVPNTAGKQLRWVQTISENGSFYKACKMRTYVDPFGKGGGLHTVSLPGVSGACKADDAKPFYYTDAERTGGRGSAFYDRPDEDKPASGRTWIRFTLALTEVTGKNVHHLVAIAWGFDRLASGAVRVASIRTPTATEMKKHGRALKRMYSSYKFT